MKLNDLDLNKLHVFRAVAESTSMRTAGERLLRTPSAVSQSVASLERSLGLPLFIRAGIRLELTEAGRRLLQQVRAQEQGLTSLLDELRGAPTQVRGRVTLGLPPGYTSVTQSRALSAALLAYPELQLRMRFLSHAQLAQGLIAREVDLALSLQPLRLWNRRLRSRALREENLILAIPPRYAHLSGASGPALAELPVVDYYQKPLLIDGWLKHHRQRRAKPRIRVFAANLDHVLQMVHGGVGCAVVPRHVVERELAGGALLEHALDRRRAWIVTVWLNSALAPERYSRGARSVWDALGGPSL